MPISLKQTTGGGLFRLRNKVTGTIASGVTGNILTLTAPAGQVARLTLLVCSSSTTQTGVSIVSDGNTVINGTLSQNDVSITSGTFFVSETYAGGSTPSSNGAKASITCVVGEVIVINKNAGNTTQSIEYSVEYGVMI